MSFRRRALFLAGLLAAVSCSDAGSPLGPEGPRPPALPPGDALQSLDCSADARTGVVRCEASRPETGAASGLIVGSQNLYVRLASANVEVVSDTFMFDATVRNLIPQALGVDSTGAVDGDGVRVFFVSGPTGNVGTVTVPNADGSQVLLNANREYYQYAGGLDPQEVSESRKWKFKLNGGATTFTFKVLVSARVRHPQGWVDINPNSALLNVGETAVLSDTVRNVVGQGVAENVNWSSSNPGVVSVTETSDSTAQIQGVATGSAWIRAEAAAASVSKDSILVTVNNAPVLALDSISAISNVTMPVDSAHGMLANDTDSDDASLVVSAGTVTTDRGGTATLSANGSFTYVSRAGFAGLDTIRYTVTDGARTLPGKAVVRVEDSRYWFVKAGGTGPGTDAAPFGTLAAAQDSAVAGDTLIVLANGVQQVDGPVTLEASQALIGQGTSEAITRGTYNGAAITVLAPGGAPSLTNTAAGATVTLGTNNIIRGVGITAGDGAAVSGTSFGTLFVREAGVNPAGPALLLSTGALDAVFDVLSSTGSNTTGLSLTDVTGSLAGTGGAIGGAVGTAFHVSGGSADVTYGGSISNASGLAVSIAGRTGGALALAGDVTDSAGGISVTGVADGTVAFSGALSLSGSGLSVGSNTGGTISFTNASKSFSTGTNAAVSLTGNTGAAVQFAGGGLAVSTTSGAGFTATGGGTVTVTGAGNTVSSTTGTAVTLNGVGTSTGGVNFQSVSANGAANGMVLSGVTGAGVQVTGDGSTAGSGGTVQNTTGHAVSLASLTGADSVHLKFMSVGGGNAGNAGLFGSDFGVLRVTGLSVGTSGGPALSLATGTLNGAFSSLGSASSASNGAILSSVAGSFTADAGSITGAASTAFAVAGGAVSATIAGSVSQASNAPLLAVSGGHNGTLTFNTGTLSATNGTGLQFNDADGTYAFNGTTTLNGSGDEGVDITNGSGGTFTFGTGVAITSPSGTAFNVNGAAPTVTYSGGITQAGNALMVDVSEQTGGSVTFDTGTLSASAGSGILLSNADGTVAFNGTTTLNGGDAGVDVVSQSSGSITFGSATSIANASGIALRVANGVSSTSLSYAGSISSSATGLAAHVEGVSGGTVTVSGSVSGPMGILVQNNTGGTITFSGSTKTLNTTVNPAVTATNNPGSSLVFSGGNLAISTTTGAGFAASGGGTVQVTGSGNTISTGTGTALSLSGVATGASGVNLASVSANGAANGIVLTNLSGPGVQVNGGTIQNTTGAGVSLTSLASLTTGVELSGMSLSRGSGTGSVVTGSFFGTLSLPGTSVTATGGPGALNLNTGTLNGTIASINASGGGAGTHAVALATVNGTYTVNGGTISGSANGDALNVNGGAATATWTAPALNSASTATQAVDVSNTTGGSYTFGTVTSPNTSGGVRIVTNGGAVTFAGLTLGTSAARYTAAPISLSMGSGNVSLGAVSIFTTGGSATGLPVTAAAGSGTLSVASGTIDAAGAPAVNIAPSSGTQPVSISLTKVSASGGPNGIIVSNTSGSFAVTGSGSVAGSGGTIQNTTGADGASSGEGSQGVGVYLQNTQNVSLAFLALSGHSNWGIRGKNVVNFTMNKTRITGTNGTTTATDEGSVYFTELTGTASITGSFIDGGFEDAVLVDNTTGTLNRITFDGDTIGSANNVDGDGMRLESSGGTLNATIQNTRFARAAGDMFQHNIIGTGVSDLVFQNNTLINGHPAISSGGGGVTITAAESGTLTYNVASNSIRGALGTALVVNKPFGGGAGNGVMSGRIQNNVIGTAGAGTGGSQQGSGMQVGMLGRGSHTTLIENNQVYDYDEFGVYFLIGGAATSTTGLPAHDGTFNATVRGNTTAEPLLLGFSSNGLQLNGGTNAPDAYQICLDLGSSSLAAQKNNFANGGTDGIGGEDMRIRQRQSTTVKLPGYGGANNDNTAVQNYLTARNTLTTVAALNSVPTGGGFTNPGATCPQPS